ncbi:iron-containing alcohol dehydrogenase, partial [bacterium]|nr:iron-containing alcohol dehydrogenase [bacterium]
FPAPHGVVCARLLPHVMEANVRALENRAPDSPALERYRETARILTGDPAAEISDGISWIREICLALRVPALGEYGITSGDFPDIVEKAREASSMKGNPIELTRKELAAILQRAM